MTGSEHVVPALVAVLVATVVAVAVLAAFRVPSFLRPASAVLRGTVQLAILAVVLSGIIADIRWVAAFLVVMFAFAVATAAGRLGRTRRTVAACAVAMATGSLIAGGIIFGLGAVAFAGRYVLAVSGILIGGSMTVATVTGRALHGALADRWDQVEGWLALGARPRQATIGMAREAAWTGLIPLTDQTRTTGLVVLPGAFVGAVFGGLSPVEAGVFQITILAGLVASGSIVAVLMMVILGARVSKPAGP
ncbi:ABC transporter permease [Microbacteriaceae bacterium VKM Ac-2854]|nr:ABC transporter permease [Microbacteriaceae bacterium VKM Ac-2854]